jgi:hypothetical protein
MEHFMPQPPAAITRVLAAFNRKTLEGFITVAIDLLDFAAGDPDMEANGDEEDGTRGEDDFGFHSARDGLAGCPVSDPGENEGHAEPGAWLERVDQTLPPLPCPVWASYRNGEDAEDEHDLEREEE